MDLTQEELDMVLEAGLEKVAYEEGLNDYAESLEKVAAVHDVDAMELHNFLEGDMEKTAEDEYVEELEKVAAAYDVDPVELHDYLQKEAEEDERTEYSDAAIKKLKRLGTGIGAVEGGALGGIVGGKIGGSGRRAAIGAGLGAGAGALGGRAGISGGRRITESLANMEDGGKIKNRIRQYEKDLINKENKKAEGKKKTAAAYGLDEETFGALFNAGLEALSE